MSRFLERSTICRWGAPSRTPGWRLARRLSWRERLCRPGSWSNWCGWSEVSRHLVTTRLVNLGNEVNVVGSKARPRSPCRERWRREERGRRSFEERTRDGPLSICKDVKLDRFVKSIPSLLLRISISLRTPPTPASWKRSE